MEIPKQVQLPQQKVCGTLSYGFNVLNTSLLITSNVELFAAIASIWLTFAVAKNRIW